MALTSTNVDLALALLGGVAVGAVVALASPLLLRPLLRRMHPIPTDALDYTRRSLDSLGVGVIVLDSADAVVLVNPAARALSIVRGRRLVQPELVTLAGRARHLGEVIGGELNLSAADTTADPLAVRVQVAPFDPGGHVAVQITDVTQLRRVEKVRRDFVANVSHELKTPVGGMILLAEAILDATDDPDAVRRFAQRTVHEATRLAHLVRELIELSRLEGAEPQPAPETVGVDLLIAEVTDRTRVAAENKEIAIVTGGERGLTVTGSQRQLATAITNLVNNAIAYSATQTKITVAVRRRDRQIEIAVSDQGIGIAESDVDRIFERFYRADQARSRTTGGTGLGLAIVKHIATNHGGSVDVWSVTGSGSTFTLRLPAAVPEQPRGNSKLHPPKGTP